MSKDPAPTERNKKRRKLPKIAKTFILKSIAAYRDDAWIKSEVMRRYNLEIAEATIRFNYRYEKAYEAQIQSYRDKWTAEAGDHPLNNKAYVLDWYLELAQEARQKGDYSAAVKAMERANKITGMETPESLEVNHTVTGGLTFENTLRLILEGKTPSTQSLPSSGDVVEIPAEVVKDTD